jgi:hypothetical protein
MPLSPRERRILAEIEDHLSQKDPELSDLFRRPPPAVPQGSPLSAGGIGRLAVVLLTLVLVHPLAAAWGAGGVGLLTAALVVPWVVVTARAGAASAAGSVSPGSESPGSRSPGSPSR